MSETSFSAGIAFPSAMNGGAPLARSPRVAELCQSQLPSMLLLLLLSAGKEEVTEPLGRAIGCLGALQKRTGTEVGDDRLDNQALCREAITALCAAVKTLRREVS